MGSISQIYFHILNTERRRLKSLPVWRRLFNRNAPKKEIFIQALSRMSDLDIAKLTKDALGYSLPQFQQQTRMAPESAPHEPTGDGSTTPRDYSKAAAMSANDFTTPTADARDALPADDDCVMSGMGVGVGASPGARDDAAEPPPAPHSPTRYAAAKASGSRVAPHLKSKDSPQLQPQEPCAELEFELHEVVVHRTETDSSPPQRAQHQRALGSGDDSVASALQKPPAAAVAARSAKAISALAPQRRGSAAARASTSAVLRPAQTARIEARDADAQQGLSQSSPKSMLPCSDGSGAISIPQPPPRSRSRSRIRQTGGGDAAVSVASGDVLNLQSLVSTLRSMEGGAGRGQTSHLPSVRPHDVKAPPASTFANPTEQIGSRLHARPRDTAAIGAVSADSATVAAPAERTARQAPAASAAAASSRAGGGVAALPLPARDTQQDKTTAALSGRRPAKSASAKRQSTRNGASALSWEETVKISKEKFGDQVEEC
jgi:hypothetical protein